MPPLMFRRHQQLMNFYTLTPCCPGLLSVKLFHFILFLIHNQNVLVRSRNVDLLPPLSVPGSGLGALVRVIQG